MLLEWGGKACPALKNGALGSRLSSSCQLLNHLLIPTLHLARGETAQLRMSGHCVRPATGGQGRVTLVCAQQGMSRWVETTGVNESNSGM